MTRRKLDIEPVTLRLFSDDVEELKRRAEEQRDNWQVMVRRIVHEAVSQPQKRRVVR